METICRVAILVSHPIQYFSPVYQELSSRPHIDLKIYYHCSVGANPYYDHRFGQYMAWDIPLLTGYRHSFLSHRTRLGGLQASILRQLKADRPNVLIIHGYNYPTNILALLLSKQLNIKTMLRGDTRFEKRHFTEQESMRILKKVIIRSFDGLLAIGSLNRDYYLHYGAEQEKIYFSPFCVNNSFFEMAECEATSAREILRRRWAFSSEDLIVLYAGKMTARKRVLDLIEAFRRVEYICPHLRLVFAGSGEQQSSLEERVKMHGIARKTLFLGFANQSLLPSIYAASDMFVLPSESEAWGLAVNEAMAAGLPVIVSDEVGAAPDLVQGKNTGFVYPCGDVGALANALQCMANNADMRSRMAVNAKTLISKWDVPGCVDGIVSAIEHMNHAVRTKKCGRASTERK